MFPIGEKLDHYEQQHEEDLKLIADLKRRLQEQDRQLQENDRRLQENDRRLQENDRLIEELNRKSSQ